MDFRLPSSTKHHHHRQDEAAGAIVKLRNTENLRPVVPLMHGGSFGWRRRLLLPETELQPELLLRSSQTTGGPTVFVCTIMLLFRQDITSQSGVRPGLPCRSM